MTGDGIALPTPPCHPDAFFGEFIDICGRIAELIDLFAEADNILEAALHEPLSREALGFASEEQEGDDGSA